MGMTEKQIESWRNTLLLMIGAYALIMPVSEIEAYRNRIQAAVDGLPESKKRYKK